MRFKDILSKQATPAVLIALVVAGCGGLMAADPQSDEAGAEAQIERRLREIFVAAENKDFSRLESYHMYGPKFTRFSGSSSERLDAGVTRQLERKGLASLKNLQMRAESLKVDMFGTVGIATFILDYGFDAGGEKIRKRERSTLVFSNESGDWKIVHEHFSEIKVAEADGAANQAQR